MSAPCVDVCTPWATEADLCPPCDGYDFDAQLLDDMLAFASDVLYRLSGRRFAGSCQDTVRPVLCGCRSTSCSCENLSQISLGQYPITEVTEVKVDGETLVADVDYRVDNFRWLVRLPDEDGSRNHWPSRQRLDLASSEEDTFEVTFTYGVPPPTAGRLAAAELACHLALACVGSDDCRLPKRVRSVSRQGVTIDTVDPQTFLEKGRIGLTLCDIFLTAYPKRGRISMYSPDVVPSVRRVGT